MIFKVFKKLRQPSKKTSPAAKAQAEVIARDNHCISRKFISSNALKVLYRLNQHEHEAYLVGGGVRDLLLGLRPKDFDIATSAHPEQVKGLFRNCRLIGRRFRLAHIYFGDELVEVATFRAGHEGSASETSRSEQGMILRDNVYGSLEQDVFRRDFSVNALYYCVKDFSVIDYCHGLKDLQQKIIRIIGEPEQRFEEDPVRMLRAVRFAAKLDFSIEAQTLKALLKLKHLIDPVSSARLYDESLKLLLAGFAIKSYKLLQEYDMFYLLFPQTAKLLSTGDNDFYKRFIDQLLINTDARIAEDKHVTPAFILAGLLWPVVYERFLALREQNISEYPALQQAGEEVLKQQCQRLAIPRRFTQGVRDIWTLQIQLKRRLGYRTEKILHYPRFRAGYDFLLLRVQAGENLNELADWWTTFIDAEPKDRKKMMHQVNKKGRSRKGKNKAKKHAES